MRRSFVPDKHWLLLSILMALVLLAVPVSRAQGQSQPGSRTQGQSSDQAPDPAQNQDQVQDLHQDQSQSPDQAQGAEQIQSQDKVQEQDRIPVTSSYDPNSEDHYSHARIVRVSYVDGQVRIDHGQGYESATMNVPVTEHNWLQTRSDGWAEIQFEDGSMVRVAPDTVIAFTELSRSSAGSTVSTVDLDQGEAEFKVAQRGDSEFQVTVRNKTIALGGSAAFRVTSTNADPLEVVVWRGEVAIRDSESGGEVAVKKNETFVLDPTDVAQYVLDKGAEADGLDQWSKQRDDYLSTYAARGGYSQSPYQYGTGDLNYYGGYFDDPGYGTVWQPNGVNISWDPFANGYWAYSPGFGYTWVSAYPWGWLPFRYGNWVFINGRGWCWVPGNWQRWHTGPTWVNAPPGFRAPAPPAGNRIVINGPPGGRVPRTNIPNQAGGVGARNPVPAVGSRTTNPNGDGDNGSRGNRRVFTNDDVARVPRTDIPKTDLPAKPATEVIDADRKPKEIDRQPVTDVQRQPQVNRSHADRERPANRSDDPAAQPRRSRMADSSPKPPVPADSQPVHQLAPPSQPAPPVHEHTQPAQQPVRQSQPPTAAPVRQSSPPPAASSSRSDDSGSRSSGKPK
jgi:hypothetical protein